MLDSCDGRRCRWRGQSCGCCRWCCYAVVSCIRGCFTGVRCRCVVHQMVHHPIMVGVARVHIMLGTIFVFQVRCMRPVFVELDVPGMKFVMLHRILLNLFCFSDCSSTDVFRTLIFRKVVLRAGN